MPSGPVASGQTIARVRSSPFSMDSGKVGRFKTLSSQWLPAHCTLEEFEAKGLPAAIWHGNDMADKAAKQVLLDAMDQAHCPADTTGKQLLHTAAKIQKATLSLQPRRLGDQAAEKEATRARNGVKVLHPMAR